jgi:hypothetical protein
MFMIYVHTKFHISSSTDSLIIAVIPKGKCRFRVIAMFSIYKQYFHKSYVFFEDLLSHKILGS